MNEILLPILADADDEIIKLIFGGVFVLIWIAGALMSGSKKKQKQQSRTPEKSWDEIFRELSGEAKRPPTQQQAPPPPPPRPVRPVQVIRQGPQQPRPTTTTSVPPSGPAVRKKLRRKVRQDAPAHVAPPPPPPEQQVPHMPVLEVSTESLAFVHSDISKTEIGARKSVAHDTSSAAAKQLRSALRPENLRHQFILTELLQPPKALRQEI